MKIYPDNAEHLEAALTALAQLLPLHADAFLPSGAMDRVVEELALESATEYMRFIGASALARFAQLGGAEALRRAGAEEALAAACRAPPGDAASATEWDV